MRIKHNNINMVRGKDTIKSDIKERLYGERRKLKNKLPEDKNERA